MTCALLQCLGKKTFGKMAGDVLELHLLFIERCTTSNSNSLKIPLETVNIITPHLTRVYSIQCSSHNPANDLVLMLFDSNGCKCLWQGLELARIIAESTNATSTTTTQYVQFTYTLIVSITPYLADERVCAELLQAVRLLFFLLRSLFC